MLGEDPIQERDQDDVILTDEERVGRIGRRVEFSDPEEGMQSAFASAATAGSTKKPPGGLEAGAGTAHHPKQTNQSVSMGPSFSGEAEVGLIHMMELEEACRGRIGSKAGKWCREKMCDIKSHVRSKDHGVKEGWVYVCVPVIKDRGRRPTVGKIVACPKRRLVWSLVDCCWRRRALVSGRRTSKRSKSSSKPPRRKSKQRILALRLNAS